MNSEQETIDDDPTIGRRLFGLTVASIITSIIFPPIAIAAFVVALIVATLLFKPHLIDAAVDAVLGIPAEIYTELVAIPIEDVLFFGTLFLVYFFVCIAITLGYLWVHADDRTWKAITGKDNEQR